MLVLGLLGAVAWAAYEWQRAVSMPEAPLATTAAEQTSFILPEITSTRDTRYPAITERPLFQASRRPSQLIVEEQQATPVKPVVVDRSGELKAYRLTAVLKDANRLMALIESTGNETKVLQVGDRIGSWETSDIYDDRIVLINGSQQEVLVLRKFEPPRANNRTVQRAPAVHMRRPDHVRPPTPPVEPAVVRAEQHYPVPSIKDVNR